MDRVMRHINSTLNGLIGEQCGKLMDIWQRMGMEEQFLLESRLPLITGWLSDLLEDMVRGEMNLEASLLESVVAKLATVRQMEAELRAETGDAASRSELAPMPDLPNSCGLIQRDNRLSQRIAELQNLRLRFAAQATLAQMRTLWRRLQIERPDSERQHWENLAASRHLTPDCLQRMDRELAKLRQQVLPRLRECIADCRREIADLASRCLVAPAELEALRPLTESTEVSEELLDRHEAQAAGLRDRLARHAAFYAALADWQSGWNSLQSLLQRLKDPAVLNNRGGVLLRLERERKRAHAAVAAKEAELMRMDDAESSLRVCGLPLAEFLAGTKQRAEEEKENEARRRLEKHETTLRRELQFGSKPASPMQRRVIHNSSRIVGACKTPSASQLLTPAKAKQQQQQQKQQQQLLSGLKTPLSAAGPSSVRRTPAFVGGGGGGGGGGVASSVKKKFTPSKIGGYSGRVEKRKSGKGSALIVTAQKLLRRSVKKLQQDCSSILVDLPEVQKHHQTHPPQQQMMHHDHNASISTSYSTFQSGVGFRSSTVFPGSSAAALAAAAVAAAGAAAPPMLASGAGGSRHYTAGSQCDSGLSSLANH